MALSVAIIGAGPSGFYAAEAMMRTCGQCRVDLIESLPTPFGLVRGGVAPDHQSTKRVARAYEKIASDERVAYFGNVRVGRDVTLPELRSMYDAVILAVGAPLDRTLELPGADKAGVYGSADFVGWYNGHPYHADLAPALDGRAVAVVGNGNVALDVARVLVKSRGEMATSDLPGYAAEAIERADIRDVYLIGRRGPVEAKFTNVELREMGRLEEAVPVLDPTVLPDTVEGDWSDRDRRLREKNLATFRELAAIERPDAARRVHFLFYAKPLEVLGGAGVEGMRLERTRLVDGRVEGTGETFEISCGAVVAAIGYRARPIEGVPFDERRGVVRNKDGRVAHGLYVVGWAMRGPSGVIGSSKPDADMVAEAAFEDLVQGPGEAKPGRPTLRRHLEGRGVKWVSFDDWRAIDAHEVDTADDPAPRRKLIRIEAMLAAAEGRIQDGAE